jgi:hypothetical protein
LDIISDENTLRHEIVFEGGFEMKMKMQQEQMCCESPGIMVFGFPEELLGSRTFGYEIDPKRDKEFKEDLLGLHLDCGDIASIRIFYYDKESGKMKDIFFVVYNCHNGYYSRRVGMKVKTLEGKITQLTYI